MRRSVSCLPCFWGNFFDFTLVSDASAAELWLRCFVSTIEELSRRRAARNQKILRFMRSRRSTPSSLAPPLEPPKGKWNTRLESSTAFTRPNLLDMPMSEGVEFSDVSELWHTVLSGRFIRTVFISKLFLNYEPLHFFLKYCVSISIPILTDNTW